MKENTIKALIAAASTALTVYFQCLIIPIAILAVFMALDYITGVAAGWITKTLSSKTGIVGIIKKVCYLIVVSVGMGVDYIVSIIGSKLGYDLSQVFVFALIVTVWLVLNEFLSILENLDRIGVPLPGFLEKVIDKLKRKTEEQMEDKP